MRARLPHYRSSSRHHRSLFNPVCLLGGLSVAVACVLVLSLLSILKSTPHQFREEGSLLLAPSHEELYGYSPGHVPNKTCTGPCQLLVLSYFNSRASLLARLLMLMGVFAGDGEQLRIDVSDRLRWWELKQVTALNDLMLQKYASPGLPPRLARGFNLTSMGQDDLEYYRDRVAGVVRYLDHHQPWLLKDPRLSWLAPLWLEQLEQPLCVVVVHLAPAVLALLAQQLGEWRQHGDEAEVSPYTHLERWTNSTLSALQACFAVPTIVVPSSVLEPPLLQPFLAVLQQHLQLAGVQGTRLPPDSLLQQQYMTHLRHTHTTGGSNCKPAAAAGPNGTVDGAALLQDSCNWLPPKPTSSAAAPGLAELPIPTRALLEALHDHLQHHLAHPQVGVDYSKVSAGLYSAYSRRVRELVREQPGHSSASGDQHSIAALIHEALRYVATEHKLPSLFKQA